MATGLVVRALLGLLAQLLVCSVATPAGFTDDAQLCPNLPAHGPEPNASYRTKRSPSTGFNAANSTISEPGRAKSGSDYWLPRLTPLGSQPLAGKGYKFYRNVVADYKTDNTGASDASEAINAVIQDGNRCGEKCGGSFTLGAIIYFPPGIYKICSPVIQLYYTQFVGDALNRPTIKGCDSFKGIALIDTDPYIPGQYVLTRDKVISVPWLPEEDIDDPQYTPSEVDALDAIPPATPPSSVRGYEDAVDF